MQIFAFELTALQIKLTGFCVGDLGNIDCAVSSALSGHMPEFLSAVLPFEISPHEAMVGAD